MEIQISKVSQAAFVTKKEAATPEAGGFGIPSALVLVDLDIDGQLIRDVPVHVGGNHINGGCRPAEAMLVVWIDDFCPHAELDACLAEVGSADGKAEIEEALEADDRIAEIKEKVQREWQKT